MLISQGEMSASDLSISGIRQDVHYESCYQPFLEVLINRMAEELQERLNIRKENANLLPFVDVIENSMALTEKNNQRAKEKELRMLKMPSSISFPYNSQFSFLN